MTELLERALRELKKRPDQEQDAIAREIFARIGEARAPAQSSVVGRGKSVLRLLDPSDTLIEIQTPEEIASWYAGKPAGP